MADLGSKNHVFHAIAQQNDWYKRLASRSLSEIVAWTNILSGYKPGFRLLLYHAVGTSLPHDSYGISISPRLFEEHMALLASTREIKIIDLFEGRSKEAPLKVAITFDDGYRDNLTIAAPILMKYQIPFTVFVTSSFILGSGSSAYLSVEELRELASLPGVTVGSHGATHVRLAMCDDSILWGELYGSRLWLEDLLGKPVYAISYPHGSVDQRVAAAATKAGYTIGLCSRRDINAPHRNPLLLCRTEILAADSARIFRQKLFGAWDWNRWLAGDPALQRQGEI